MQLEFSLSTNTTFPQKCYYPIVPKQQSKKDGLKIDQIRIQNDHRKKKLQKTVKIWDLRCNSKIQKDKV